MEPSLVYRFGSFALDVGDRSLKRNGTPISLTPKHFDLLVALVGNAGRLIEKETLLRSVWPGVSVEEGNLAKGVSGLRRALGANGDTEYIETVPTRGYRFVAGVRRESAADPWLGPAAAGVAASPASMPASGTSEAASLPLLKSSIAILPFTDLSESRDQEFLCDGLCEEIVNALGRLPDLIVASYTSARRFRGRDVDARVIGRELTVTWLLEGSVRRSWDTVRISVQLVRTSDGFTVWSDRFDRRLESVFALPDEIATAVARTLTRRVSWDAQPRLTSMSSSAEAYLLYLEGRYLWNKRSGDVVGQALDRFERAIDIDPKFAQAHAALASVYAALGAWEYGVLPPGEALAKAKDAARRALSIDPLLPDGHTFSGFTALHFDWNPDAARQELDHALALNPTCVDAHHWRSHALCAAGRFSESLVASRVALELDPLNPLMHAHLAWHYYMAREFPEALGQGDHVIRMEPSFHWGHFSRGWALERLGRHSEAIAAFREAVRCSPENPVMLAGLGHTLAAAQDRLEATRIADELVRLRRGRGLFAYELCVIHTALGAYEPAFEWLTRAVAERSGWIAYVGIDPRLDDLRADPRYRAVTLPDRTR